MQNLVIGSDHRGFQLKESLKLALGREFNFIDVGCYSAESVDYPLISADLAKKLKEVAKADGDVEVSNTFAVIICGSGIGISIAVNRFPFIRGALVYNEEVAKTSRQHNNANTICLAADYLSTDEAVHFIKLFVAEKFEGGRHQRRVDELAIINK
ncbi:MAG: RpiB/LacA/LacB family sugar-phosphate isomerase [Alphaproteobacteria bacterium]|nr:RpiB/LacA/LacB family sugar-phosphate isomerase [Alphaproteobacteria bacterium]